MPPNGQPANLTHGGTAASQTLYRMFLMSLVQRHKTPKKEKRLASQIISLKKEDKKTTKAN